MQLHFFYLLTGESSRISKAYFLTLIRKKYFGDNDVLEHPEGALPESMLNLWNLEWTT